MTRARFAALPLAAGALIVARSPPALRTGNIPSRPIRVMLPFAAGSVSDVTLRILADKLGARLNTSIIVDNQPRAGGTTAALAAKTATPDGYTLVTLSSSTAISVSLLKALPYDPVGDFLPISGISTFANIIAVNARLEIPHARRFLAAAREKPGTLNIGTTTVGSTNHLAANLLKSMTGLDFVIVPFRTPGDLLDRRAAQRRRCHHPVLWRAEIRGRKQPDPGARQHHAEARGLCARCADRGRGRRQRLRCGDLERRLRAGRDPARGGRHAQPRDCARRSSDPELEQRFTELGLEPLPSTPDELSGRLRAKSTNGGGSFGEAGIEQQ